MQFLSPGAFWGLIAIPIIILFYVLKQRFEERQVSSTFLWSKALQEFEASYPWQRLNNNLLLFLQILIALLIVFSLSRPTIKSAGVGGDAVIVIDTSLSMKAMEDNTSRIDRAKEQALEIINQMSEGEKISIMIAGANEEILLHKSDNLSQAKGIISNIVAQNGNSDIEKCIDLAHSLKEDKATNFFVFTDQNIDNLKSDNENERIILHNVALGSNNVAFVNSIANVDDDNSVAVMGLMQNYGSKQKFNVECYADGQLTDIKEVEIGENQSEQVVFEDLPEDTQYIKLAIDATDALNQDNEIYCTVNRVYKKQILLMTPSNIFLQKALELREDVELSVSNDLELSNFNEYDLVVFDGILPENIPENISVWLINPPKGYAGVESVRNAGTLVKIDSDMAEEIFKYVNQIIFASSKIINNSDGLYLPLAKSDNDLIMAYKDEGAKTLIMGFSIQESTLPVSQDMPILTGNILTWFFEAEQTIINGLEATDSLIIQANAETEQIEIITPENKTIVLPSLSPAIFEDTDTIGIYQLVQKNKQAETIKQQFFSVNAAQGESELRTQSQDQQQEKIEGAMMKNKDLRLLFAFVALCIIMLEWWVYNRAA